MTGIAWHLLGVRKTEEKQTRRLSQVVPLKGGLLMSVAFFRPPNHRVPEGLVAAFPLPPPPRCRNPSSRPRRPRRVFHSVSATLSDLNNFRARRNRVSIALPASLALPPSFSFFRPKDRRAFCSRVFGASLPLLAHVRAWLRRRFRV